MTPRRTMDCAQRLRDGGERLSTEAGDRARGLVGQGLERSAEALANVSKLVGDTADGLDERLGQEYGDYARRGSLGDREHREQHRLEESRTS